MHGAKKGTNLLILKGAQIYLYSEQLLSDSKEESPMAGKNVGLNKEKPNRECSNTKTFNRQLSEKEKKIIESISINAKTIEELSLSTKIKQVELLELLSIQVF